MKKIIPIAIAVVSVVAIVSVLVVKGFKNEQPVVKNEQPVANSDTDQKNQQLQDNSNIPPGKAANVVDIISSSRKYEGPEKKYVNNTAGYQISIPDLWEGYIVSEMSSGPEHSQIAFGFMEQNSKDFYDMMILSEQPKNVYEGSNKEGSGLVYVGEVPKNKSVILCGGGCCKGMSLNPKSDSFLKSKCGKVPEILKTFRAL